MKGPVTDCLTCWDSRMKDPICNPFSNGHNCSRVDPMYKPEILNLELFQYSASLRIQWNLGITRSLDTMKMYLVISGISLYLGMTNKHKPIIERAGTSKIHLVIRGNWYIWPLYNEVPLYNFFWTVKKSWSGKNARNLLFSWIDCLRKLCSKKGLECGVAVGIAHQTICLGA